MHAAGESQCRRGARYMKDHPTVRTSCLIAGLDPRRQECRTLRRSKSTNQGVDSAPDR
jgi:hypothetical protein